VAAVLLSLILASTVAASAVHPMFVRADSGAGNWAGFTGRIQVRPDTFGMAVWPGGYLGDGTFVQAGVYMPGSAYTLPGEAKLFFWATTNTADPAFGPFPLQWISIPNATLWSWYVVEATKVGNIWTFRYQDPALAWHTAGTFLSTGTLGSFQIVAEYWAEGPQPFATQAIQHAWVKNTTGGWFATPMWYSADSERCGHDAMTSTTPSNALFKSTEGGACVYRLW